MTRQVHADARRADAERSALEHADSEAGSLPDSIVYLTPPAVDPDRVRRRWRAVGAPIRLRVRTFDGLVTDALERATFHTSGDALTADGRQRLVERAVDALDDDHPLVSGRATASAQTYAQAEDVLSLLEFAGLPDADAIHDDDRLADLSPRIRTILADLSTAFADARDDRAEATGDRPSIRSERYRAVIDHPDALAETLAPADTVVFGDYAVFSALERDLLDAIADSVPTARAVCPLAGDVTDDELADAPVGDELAGVDRAVERAWSAYRRAGFEVAPRRSGDGSDHDGPSERLVRRLYRYDDADPLSRETVESAGVERRQYPTADHELRGAFRQVAEWIDGGTNPADIGVVVSDLASCTAQVAETARQYDVSPAISREVGLAQTELGEVLVDAFRLADDPTTRDLLRLVDNPLVTPDWPGAAVDPGQLLTAGSALEATDLDTLVEFLRDDDPETVESIRWLRARCARLADCTAESAARRIADLLADLGVLDDTADPTGARDATDVPTDWSLSSPHTGWPAERERSALRAVRDVVTSFDEVAVPADVAFVDRLQTAIDSETVEVETGTADDVQVVTPAVADHRSYERVVVLGLTDDRTPTNPTRLAFARRVNETHADFAERDAVQQTRHAVARQLADADRVVLSRPHSTVEGDETVPADVLTELARVTADDAIPTERLTDTDSAPRSREDLQRRLASGLADHRHDRAGTPTDSEAELVESVAEADALRNASGSPTERLRAGVACAAGRRSPVTTAYDGTLSPETAAEFDALSTPLSPSRVDRYVTCGFQFYAKTVLGFDEPDDEPLELDALDSGRFVHNVVARFVASLQSEPGDPVTVGTTTEYHTAMYEAGVDEVDRDYVQAHDSTFHDGWLQRLFAGLDPDGDNEYDGPPGYEGLLVRTLRSLADETERFTARPAYVEADIGVSATGPVAEPTVTTGRDDDPVTLLAGEPVDLVPDAPFRFRGTVDRVDVVPDTSPTTITAIDYKTGSHPTVQDIREGVSFQLPLYLRLLESALDDAEAVGAAYYTLSAPTEAGLSSAPFTSRLYTSYGGGTPLRRQRTGGLFDYHRDPDAEPFDDLDTSSGETVEDLDPDDRFSDFLHDTLDERLRSITQSLQAGVFHPTLLGADAANCDYCAYADVCDVRHHQRVDRIEDHGLGSAYVPAGVRPEGGR